MPCGCCGSTPGARADVLNPSGGGWLSGSLRSWVGRAIDCKGRFDRCDHIGDGARNRNPPVRLRSGPCCQWQSVAGAARLRASPLRSISRLASASPPGCARPNPRYGPFPHRRRRCKTFFERESDASAPHRYTMPQSPALYLIGPEGDWRYLFDYKTLVSDILADLQPRL